MVGTQPDLIRTHFRLYQPHMLTCMAKAFALIGEHKHQGLDLATIPQKDAATYAMICKADTLGTFQIESRAQMSMLPRMKPETFYDLVISGDRPARTDPG